MKKILLISLIFIASSLYANQVEIVKVTANCEKDQTCRFDVTLKHEDTGWKHFANKWEVYTPKDELLATRTLYHPHVNEQPFTRSLGNVKIPKGVNKVIIKAHDNVHGYAKKTYEYTIK